MPAKDPVDQEAARDYEQRLRYDVFAGRAPETKLDWFTGLPKKVRRSRRLIGEALGPYEEALERVREARERSMVADLELTFRLAALRAQPRDLDCLKGKGTPWSGLGRRKKRCRAFRATGRAFVAHQSVAARQSSAPTSRPQHPIALPTPSAPVDIMSLSTFAAPKRPVTPPGLRDAVYKLQELVLKRQPLLKVKSTECRSPDPMYTPPPAVRPALPPPVYPSELGTSQLTVFGEVISPDFAFIVATGRHAAAPWQDDLIRNAAVDIATIEMLNPGTLGQLAAILFPGGVKDYSSMLDPTAATLLDFCRGWYELAHQM